MDTDLAMIEAKAAKMVRGALVGRAAREFAATLSLGDYVRMWEDADLTTQEAEAIRCTLAKRGLTTDADDFGVLVIKRAA